jgi:ZIP family zinc transporter
MTNDPNDPNEPNDTNEPKSDGGVAQAPEQPEQPFGLPRWVIGILPIVLLALVVGGFMATTPLAGLAGGEPLPAVSIDYVTLPNDDTIRLHVTNNAGAPVTIEQAVVNEAHWQFSMSGAGGDHTIEPLGSATITIPHSWMQGYDYGVGFLTESGVKFSTTLVAANASPGLTGQVIWTLALVGFLVGIVPIVLGMLWFPFFQTMSTKWLNVVLAFSAGILGYLIFDGGFEAFETAGQVPSAFSGAIIVVLGIVGTWLLIQAVMDWGSDDEESRLSLAYSAAFGIGVHNLAEGLAIGAAFAAGLTSLGVFLIIGFMIHNVTEGPVIVAPLADGERPSLGHFVAFGLIAGAPAILGGWIGTIYQSPLVTTLFLAVGVGALLQVVFDIGDIVRRSGSIRSAPNMVAFAIGLAFMYGTGLLTL